MFSNVVEVVGTSRSALSACHCVSVVTDWRHYRGSGPYWSKTPRVFRPPPPDSPKWHETSPSVAHDDACWSCGSASAFPCTVCCCAGRSTFDVCFTKQHDTGYALHFTPFTCRQLVLIGEKKKKSWHATANVTLLLLCLANWDDLLNLARLSSDNLECSGRVTWGKCQY